MNHSGTRWVWLALVASAAAVAGSLYLSIGMGLIACPLCFYQRTFAMAVFGVLSVGLLAGERRGAFLSLLALPLAVGGLAVAGYHVFLEARGTLECPEGILGLGTAPQQSLAAFVLLTLPLVVDVAGACCGAGVREGSPRPASTLAAFVLGGLFAAGCVFSAPPPKHPDKPYDEPPKVCRPAFHESHGRK
jgi:disulfide bond formation protein DsbB